MLTARVCQSVAMLSTHVTKCMFIIIIVHSPWLFLLPTASSFSASQYLKTYEDEFVAVVHAKQSLSRLKYKGVISEDVKASIESANEEDAKYLLLEHLEKNATVGMLKEYCNVAIAADAFPRMQELGRKMIKG